MYLCKLCANVQVHGEGVEELQSYASACSLLEAGLTETLVLHIDWRGNVIAVNLYVRPDSSEAATKVRRMVLEDFSICF